MKNNHLKKSIIFLLIVIILSVIVILFYYIFIKKENPFDNIIKTIINSNVNDSYNGIYIYEDYLDKTYYIYENCSLNKISNYIIIKNDKYYAYRGSCMGTFYKESGDVKNLTISADENGESYIIKYHDLEYIKNHTITVIRPYNNIKYFEKDIDLTSLQLIIDETEVEGYYYNMENRSIKNNKFLRFYFDYDNNYLSFDNEKTKKTIYEYYINDIKRLPELYPYGNNFVIIERDNSYYNDDMYGYNIVFITPEGISYNLREQFPITVDNVVLDFQSNSIYVKYNSSSRDYTIVVGYDKKMCGANTNSPRDIAYYEFTVKYNYLNNSLEKPEFKKIGYKNEDCRYIENIIGG